MGNHLFDEYLESSKKLTTPRSRRLMTGFGVFMALFGCNAVTQPYALLQEGESGCYIPIGRDGANTRSGPLITIPPDNNIVGELDPYVHVKVSQVTQVGEFVHVTDASGQTFYIHRSVSLNGGNVDCR